jgi:hypothetical protein
MSNFSATGFPYLVLLLLLPLGWWWMRRHRVPLPYPRPQRLAKGSRSVGQFWWHWPTVFRSAALLLVAMALVQPVRIWERIESEREGVAIMLAVDISSSMLAEDFRPDNRIEGAKREVVRFVEGRESDWVGLVAFAGEALTMVPGTLVAYRRTPHRRRQQQRQHLSGGSDRRRCRARNPHLYDRCWPGRSGPGPRGSDGVRISVRQCPGARE